MRGTDSVNRPPRLTIAEVVTPEHGKKFAHEWYRRTTDAMVQAFAETGVVAWPEDSRPAQGRFHDIEDEITERVFDAVQGTAVEAFVRIASEVLIRERGEQAMKQQKPQDATATPAESTTREYPALDPIAPQTEYQHVPDYYANRDIPHVLARVRAGDRYFGDIVDGHPSDTYTDFYAAHLRILEKELQPYALYLALSLIALEDSLRKDKRDR
jgi:hypothetical protein